MAQQSKREYLELIYVRYRHSGRAQTQRILDEVHAGLWLPPEMGLLCEVLMAFRFTVALVLPLVYLTAPALGSAEVQTSTAMHTYILGDRDSKEDARQRCLLEPKRKILEQAAVYIESASEVKNFDLTKDKITSFAAAVMQVKNTNEEFGFHQGHMTLTLTLTATVDSAEVQKLLAARQVDKTVRDTVAAQQEGLKYLETQFDLMQQQMQQAPGHAPASPQATSQPQTCRRCLRGQLRGMRRRRSN